MHYDLLVCGAGPAGTIAAAQAAQAGLKVALLEKYPLPRHKTCGGGMPVAVQHFLRDLVPEAFVESNVRYMRHTWNFTNPYLGAISPSGSARALSLWMVRRSVFDHALAQRAVRAGAELWDGLVVRSLQLESQQVVVRAQALKADGDLTPKSEFVATAPYVIGADGANGVTAKATGLRQKRAISLAMEIEYPYQWHDHPELKPAIAHLEYGAVKQGYAWIFPKADHLNIGAGVFRFGQADARREPQVKSQLQQAILGYLDLFQLPYDPSSLQFHAHPLPIWNGREPLHTPDGQVLLAGDAAGLINPFFGDGILHAVKSGIIAAECVVNGTTLTYSDRIHAEFAANFDTARTLASCFYQFPSLFYRYGIRQPMATYLATRLLSGDLQFTEIMGRAVRRLGRTMTGGFQG
ncbi:geranylgeranyl reductase family protein [Pantanalinema sp. GBBB05]|uniref:geranylgeranyl reductase family protein n=1 Tax=Pantanalinema sp. GBBB05 TaxID=2604139 RepID=UPI001DC4F5EB|nr:geranylgeranyl reductase family protein [Pantanalinema sp. GBBB05]